ncbi:DUF4328 domain-containing protein [Streptomyces sp. NPDC003487]
MTTAHQPYPLLPDGAHPFPRGPLTVALAGLGVAALGDLFSLFAGVRLRSAIDGDDGFLYAAQRELADAADLYDTAGQVQFGAYLLCAVAFVVWFFRMRRATEPLGPDRFRHGSGWAIAAWLIPLGNLWLPYQVASDMWSAATQLPEDGPYRARTWPVTLWWTLFAVSTVFGRVSDARYRSAEGLGEIKGAITQYMIADLLNLAAAAAAVYFALQLTSMQRRKAAEGWYRTSTPPADATPATPPTPPAPPVPPATGEPA